MNSENDLFVQTGKKGGGHAQNCVHPLAPEGMKTHSGDETAD